MACSDRANVVAAQASYVYEHPINVPANLAACLPGRVQCQKPNGTNHRNAAGAVVTPMDMCLICETRAGLIVGQNRKLATAPPAAPFDIRARAQLLTGGNGAHTRGRLCRRCTNTEIAAYYSRRLIDNMSVQKASRTCKCEKEMRKRYCMRDRVKMCTDIQTATDRIAGANGWLKHIRHSSTHRRARYLNHNAIMLANRRAANY